MTALSRQAFEANPYKFLNRLLKKAGRQDIQGVNALLLQLTGNQNAALMLDHFLRVVKYAKDKRGVYKSWRDWKAILGISRSTSNRQRTVLAEVGLRQQVAQVAGRGTPTFYRLDWKAFIRALAKVFGVGVMTIRAWMAGEESPEKKHQKKPRVSQPETSACFTEKHAKTDSTQRENTKHNSVAVFRDLPHLEGVDEKTAVQLAREFGLEAYHRAVSYVKQRNASNPGGYLRETLRNRWYDAQGASWRTHNSGTDWQAVAAEHGLVGRKNPFEGMSFSQFAAKGSEVTHLQGAKVLSWSDFAT